MEQFLLQKHDCLVQPRPHWLEPTIYSSEEDGLSRASSDGVGGDTLNMLSVAVKIVSDKSESNTKGVYFILLYH